MHTRIQAHTYTHTHTQLYIIIRAMGLKKRLLRRERFLVSVLGDILLACVLGGSGGAVNSLYFYLASLKSHGCFYLRCLLSSQWKVVTVNLQSLQGLHLRHFWRPIARVCLATTCTNKNLLFVLYNAKTQTFSSYLRSYGQPKNLAKTLLLSFIYTHPPPFPCNSCKCNCPDTTTLVDWA